jgi:adenosylcobinamide-GDP ribazoletransferase
MMRRPFQRISWQAFISAIQFLTIIPCGQGTIFNARAALPHFPLCGLLIGGILVGIHALSGLLWPDPIVALLDVVSLVVLTGGLHLDGLADTADGLYGRRSQEQALAIMKDSRIGAMGTISVVCCLAAKWAGTSHLIGPAAPLWLLLVPAYARSAVLFGIKALPYGRPGGGTAHAFFQTPLSIKDFWGFGLLAGISLLSGRVLIGLNLGFAIVVIIIIGWYRKKIQCITGDMLGAMIEVTEATLFLIAAAQWSG